MWRVKLKSLSIVTLLSNSSLCSSRVFSVSRLRRYKRTPRWQHNASLKNNNRKKWRGTIKTLNDARQIPNPNRLSANRMVFIHKIMTHKVTLFSTFLLPALRGLQCVLHGQFNIKWSQLSSLWRSGTNLWIDLTTVLSPTWTFATRGCLSWPGYVPKIHPNGHCACGSFGSRTYTMSPSFRSLTTSVHLRERLE